ncbi:OmpH family outer membrane protein [Tamlana sp. 2_MG-2023]|uniref:OmpH family outer membrane protein n=1 Tax=unclassified Tamlana TaxID=2614803 RepID=UPI0026E1E8D0|nr:MULTISPECIES: OmpH family outer membrane protein [unclassified Tamlana]MDO6761012.1 OmpH family outer membrane protein [Tamlana sp. 2_MG-2023]MDO6791655.1 OmpH family outer membrane protein [Tamlana sp. 1_MG-2023]
MKRALLKKVNLNKNNISPLRVTNNRNMLKYINNNVLFLLILIFTASSITSHAQRGVRIGYIDTEYILENVPEYQEASNQLNQKVEKWKNEIHEKLKAVEQKRKDLTTEKVLLTEELIHEREEDIDFEESEILDYQQKRFGPNGDLFIQKKQLMQPIQDQIFAAVQDIAEGKKYDFIFDKSSDATMLFSAKRYDLSEQILRSITRSAKRNQAQNRAQRRAAEEEELIPEINEELDAREQALEDKRTERDSIVDARRQAALTTREAKKQAAAERRQQIIEERERAQQAKIDERNGVTPQEETPNSEALKSETPKDNAPETKTREQLIEENRQKKLADREARKRELEERKRKILEERQRVNDSINQNK